VDVTVHDILAVILYRARRLHESALWGTDRYGFGTGGVSTSGGFSFGGRAVTLGAGRTSIGGGSGGTCWLTTGALVTGGAASGRGPLVFGFG
jgi:hypothetical protein